PPFFVIDDPDRLARLAARLNWPIPIEAIGRPVEAGACFGRALPVLPLRLPGGIEPGRPDPTHAPSVLEALERAVALTVAGAAAGIVTNPIHKQSLYEAG